MAARRKEVDRLEEKEGGKSKKFDIINHLHASWLDQANKSLWSTRVRLFLSLSGAKTKQ